MTDDTKSNSSPTQIRFKVAKSYGRAQVQRRKTIQNFYEFQKKCLELSAEYYQGIANLLEETDVSLFLAPPTPGADPLNIINETGMVMSGMLGPGYVVNDRFIGGKLLKKRVYGEDVEVNDNNSEEAYYSENQKAKHRRAPRQLWSDEEVERLKAAHDRYNGDWELIIKEFEPERTRIQIFQKARQMGLHNEGEEDEEIEETINFENSRIEIKNEKNYTDPKENNKKNEG
ncbi:732_t:CDS:2 [Entrophospora sp. SA101]|nr:15170_t:CDS:2 [Entrophospora candida]CAH1761222.1 2724_t:CDS:2 [Entrophospora sp. SA101]CAJ0633362.1 6740_t:CDS:2 [Entrophospora sp. SA101]CAJ0755134.1 732_t:CDS:2 [Entrophospora sp. SA101]CAJ0844205.1 6294_t:CDS:2 [Entrophospora sp. SA101]